MSTSFASMVLYGWPLVVVLLFRVMPRAQALATTIIGGYVLLPTGIGLDLPVVPRLDKASIPALSAAMALLIGMGSGRLHSVRGAYPPSRDGQAAAKRPRAAPGALLLAALTALLFLSPFLTILTNSDPVAVGPQRVLPGLGLYDAASVISGLLVTVLPFILAQRYLCTPRDHAVLLGVIATAALLYSLPTLWEIRMSPQLHRQFYGFFPHSWAQHVRDGGFRPIVFLQHGLWLAIFMAMGTLAAAALVRHMTGRAAILWLFATGWLFMTLALSNSLGALLIALVLLPVTLLSGARLQLVAATTVAVGLLVYPMLRGADLVPVDRIVAVAERIDAQRAASMRYRFDNEDILLEKAQEKPLTGWGTWGRNRVYDDTGRDISTTDGAWVIIVGSHGWLGYVARFGLLCLPIVFLFRRRHEIGISHATAGLTILMAANLTDMIPNATLTPVTWLVGGALAGRYLHALSAAPASQTEAPPAEAVPPAGATVARARYTRFPDRATGQRVRR